MNANNGCVIPLKKQNFFEQLYLLGVERTTFFCSFFTCSGGLLSACPAWLRRIQSAL